MNVTKTGRKALVSDPNKKAAKEKLNGLKNKTIAQLNNNELRDLVEALSLVLGVCDQTGKIK